MPFYSNGFGDLLKKMKPFGRRWFQVFMVSILKVGQLFFPKVKPWAECGLILPKTVAFSLDSWCLNFRMGGLLKFWRIDGWEKTPLRQLFRLQYFNEKRGYHCGLLKRKLTRLRFEPSKRNFLWQIGESWMRLVQLLCSLLGGRWWYSLLVASKSIPTPESSLISSIWSCRVWIPKKLKHFLWSVVHRSFNTQDVLQRKCRRWVLSPSVCSLCLMNKVFGSHFSLLFL